MKKIFKTLLFGGSLVFALGSVSCVGGSSKTTVEPAKEVLTLMGNRFLTLNTVVRVNQIEVTRNKHIGVDERDIHTPERAMKFREAIEKGFPGSKITWAFSWLALHDSTDNYRKIREYAAECHRKYGDEVTFIPGAYFANAYDNIEQINKDLHEGLQCVSEFVGDSYKPNSIVAGFLSSKNQKYLSEVEGIHVCQGNIWSQYAIDNQDGDGAVSYPFYPSIEHFCKPAQGKEDFVDCVNLDGWTVDFLAARREGFAGGFNSRMGVGPIETYMAYGHDVGLKEILHTTAIHFDDGFEKNDFAWVTNCWELCLKDIDNNCLTDWLKAVRERWPDTKLVTQGEFGLLWRDHFKENNFDYKFHEKGSGIGGSDADKEIDWYMIKDFRMSILRDVNTKEEKVIDFTRYDVKAQEPESGSTRNWTLFGDINQKQTRKQDAPVVIEKLSDSQKALIKAHYPELVK